MFFFIKKLYGNKDLVYVKYMGDVIFKIFMFFMLFKIVDGISNLELSKDRDIKGDLYEYLLFKVVIVGING